MLIRKMNYVLFVANDGDFHVVRLDEIMTKPYLELLFFKIHLDLPPPPPPPPPPIYRYSSLLLVFYIIYKIC